MNVERIRKRMEAILPSAIKAVEESQGFALDVSARGEANFVDVRPFRSGIRGFYDTIAELAAVGDKAEREEAVRAALGDVAPDYLEFINLAAEVRQDIAKANYKGA